MGQTDGQMDGQDQHTMGPPSRKDGPIIKPVKIKKFLIANCSKTDDKLIGDLH